MSKQGFILRYLLIIRIIRNKRYISLPELIRRVEDGLAYYDDTDDVGVSRRTILRDLREIRSGMNISIEYSRTENGYYIPDDEDQFSDIERILEQYDLLTSLRAREELSEFVFPEKRKPRGTENLSPLIHAIKRRLTVEFTYMKFKDPRPSVRKVMPYALKEGRGRWYLLAVEEEDDVCHAEKIKSWGLDRIRDLKVTDKRFVRNTAIDPEKEFRDVVGAYSREDLPVEEVILSFSPKGGKYIDAFPLHSSQETLVDNDEEFRIRLRIKITYDFKQELLAQSDVLTVIAPEHLRQELCEVYRKALERNGIPDAGDM